MLLSASSFFRVESVPDPAFHPDGTAPLRAISGADPAVLMDIVRPEIGLAVWSREVDPAWHRDAAAFRPASVPVRGGPFDLARSLARHAPDRFPVWLKEDLSRLADFLSVLAATSDLTAGFAVLPSDDPPLGLRLFCRYGIEPLRWCQSDPDGVPAPGGAIDPFAVVLLKGAFRPALRRRAIRLFSDAPPGDAGRLLSIEPALAACISRRIFR